MFTYNFTLSFPMANGSKESAVIGAPLRCAKFVAKK